MRLFITVFTRMDYEPEWVIWTCEHYPDSDEQYERIKKFMMEELEYSENEDLEILDYWTNEIPSVDGYKVKLIKEQKNER